MISFEECGAMLDDIADSIPFELYRELNGGIRLDPSLKIHPAAVNNDLYILGVYIRDNLGRSIKIYYGSFVKVFPRKNGEEAKKELRRILLHELRHHNEYLAGIDDLVIYDHKKISEYLSKKKK